MIRKSTPLLVLVLVGLLAAGCSLLSPPKYYDRTKTFTKKGADASRNLVVRYLEREDLARVKPWERDLLSRPEMGWTPDPAETLRRNHIFFSKESSLGGASAGGGGCGCN